MEAEEEEEVVIVVGVTMEAEAAVEEDGAALDESMMRDFLYCCGEN